MKYKRSITIFFRNFAAIMTQDRLWNRNYCKVMAANFSLFFAFYVLTPLLPLYLSEHFGATKDVIGMVLSGYTITALLVRPFSGYVVDTFPRKKVLLICFTAFAIFFAGYLAASTLLLFLIVRTLHGGPFGALTVANSTVAIDVLPSSRRTEGIGYYGLSNNLAMAIAPTIGIWSDYPRPLLPSARLALRRQYGGLWLQLWRAEQLSGYLWQGGDGYHGWHWHVFHAVQRRTDTVAHTRWQGVA